VLALTATAAAQTDVPGRSFSWQREAGAEGCPTEADVRGKIVGMLGEDPFAGVGAPEIHAVVARADPGEGLVARVRLKEAANSPETTREFHSPSGDCAALTDAVSLAVTLALSSEPAAAPSTPRPSDNLPPPAFVADRGAPFVAQHSGEVGPWTAAAQVLWTLGVLPKPEAGVGLEVRYAVSSGFLLAAGGDWLPPASEGGQFSVSLLKAKLAACVVPFRKPSFAISGCASGEGGALRVGNELATLPTAGTHAWFGAGLTARATARLASRWIVEGGAGALVPTTRPIFATPACPLLGFQQPAATLSIFISTGVLF
jgi:hypothetical protein